MSLPFIEQLEPDGWVKRIFDPLDAKKMRWHTDDEDRLMYVLHNPNWRFQYDNFHSFIIKPNKVYKIAKGVNHRLIAGDEKIEIFIKKL